eukprot:1798825-Pleurochrysis_carterae.AAC.1
MGLYAEGVRTVRLSAQRSRALESPFGCFFAVDLASQFHRLDFVTRFRHSVSSARVRDWTRSREETEPRHCSELRDSATSERPQSRTRVHALDKRWTLCPFAAFDASAPFLGCLPVLRTPNTLTTYPVSHH